MLRKGFLTILVLFLVPFFAGAESAFRVDFFPRAPFSELLLPDARSFVGFRSPGADLSELETKRGADFLPFLTFGRVMPLLGVNIAGKVPRFVPDEVVEDAIMRGEILEKKNLLAVALIGDIAVRGTGEGAFTYEVGGRILLNSPKIDATLNFSESRFFVGLGIRERGMGNPMLLQREVTNHTLFGDVYIVGASPWSEEWLILKIGINDLPIDFSHGPRPNLAFAMELPSVLPKDWFKLAPAFSIYAEIVESYAYLGGQLGLLIEGRETGRGAFIYGMVECEPQGRWQSAIGVKLNV